MRNTLLCLLSALTLLAAATPATAETASASKARLKAAIEAAIPRNALKQIGAGIYAISINRKDVLYEHNANSTLIPASVNKVFTAYTALKRLKPTSTFKTGIYIKGTLEKEGTLNGDLYLKGSGDPSLVSERMWMLVNELVRSGIKTITGNLIADATYFDTERTPESRPKYLKDQAYNSPIGALSFNFNTTTVYVRPGENPKSPPIVYTDPDNSYIDVVNQATTGTAGSNNTLSVNRTNYVKGDVGDTVLLRGSIPLDGKEQRFYRNIVNPSLYTAHMFRTFWEQRGLKLSGDVVEGQVPDGARMILEFESLPLWHIVWGMNKFSNNFVADQLMKRIGAEVYGTPGTLQKGIAALSETLQEIGVQKNTYEILDGSGLTRGTRVTPKQIVTVLAAAYQDPVIGPEFSSSLGIAGEDGTIKSRFPNSTVTGILRAKTGSLDGVTSLAGFTPSADGEMLAFAVLLNDPRMKFGRMTGWADQIAIALSHFSRR